MPPSLLFAMILAITIGLLFHSVFGQRFWQLPLFTVSATIGLLGGMIAGTLMEWDLWRIGNIPLPSSIFGALVALWICWFFTAPLHEGRSDARRRGRRMTRRASEPSA